MNVGQRVRVTSNDWPGHEGEYGTVEDICLPDVCVMVKLDGTDGPLHYSEDDLTVETRESLEKRLAALEREARVVREQLEALPPFEAGQHVRVTTGRAKNRIVTVTAVEKAFGQWMAQVQFPELDETYTYPCLKLAVA